MPGHRPNASVATPRALCAHAAKAQYPAASIPNGSAESWSMSDRPQKITFRDMRESGVRGVLIYCSDYRCSHHIAISADRWPDDVRLSDLEPRFICSVCGKRGADVRPDFNWDRPAAPTRGF
jgi:hypothetical protein